MLFCTFKGRLSVLAMYIFGLNYKLSIYCTQGKGNVILTKNSKGKFPHNPLLFFFCFQVSFLKIIDKRFDSSKYCFNCCNAVDVYKI